MVTIFKNIHDSQEGLENGQKWIMKNQVKKKGETTDKEKKAGS